MNWVRALGVVSIIIAFASGVVYAQNVKHNTVLDSLLQDGYTVHRVVIDDTNGNAAIYLKRGN